MEKFPSQHLSTHPSTLPFSDTFFAIKVLFFIQLSASEEALLLKSRMHSQIVLTNCSNLSFFRMGSENWFAHLSVHRNYLEPHPAYMI